MLKSMTGFGKAATTANDVTVTVEVRSLNSSKGMDLGAKLPSRYREYEHQLRQQITTKLQRGKVDVYVTVVSEKENAGMRLNKAIVKAHFNELNAIAKEFGAVFIIGIGNKLSHGDPHDGRAADYDDWSTENEEGYKGLNGDIIVWHPVLQSAFEISSMGIRVDKNALTRQLKEKNCEQKSTLPFHSSLLTGKLPESIGGGIGQSRLCMFLLRKSHIGEVQVSIWSAEEKKRMSEKGVV
ncbi:MAG TPA: hypothetical protein PL084_10450, partial [Chitinophagales bacterium]|nr:hypothetical protein [Chitinophagales bacterium]